MIEQLEHRILVLDGAMGTMIQSFQLTADDYHGKIFRKHSQSLAGNHDILSLTRPDVISSIHRRYLEAGADIIETNTFSANRISQADYGVADLCRKLNEASARLARQVADEMSTPEKPRFVCGILGPTNQTTSLSPDVSNPAHRNVSFDDLVIAYAEQIEGLLAGGVDTIMVETIFDTLNAKAALWAIQNVFAKQKKTVPIMVSVTITDKSGRTLSGQTLEAFWISIKHTPLLSVGLNCAFGAKELRPHLEELAELATCGTSIHPNAGLPNELGEYDDTPASMSRLIGQFADRGLVNIVGGCCGTTPAHIMAIADRVRVCPPRKKPIKKPQSQFSGLEALTVTEDSLFINVGERTNMAGSARFRRLIREEKFEEALSVARQQIQGGAQMIDINVDDGLLDGPKIMEHFLRWVASDPEISRVPIMIDSSNWEVLEAGLKNIQGRSIVNSLSLKDGEEILVERARKVRQYGGAVLVMAFDEKGQAETLQRKIEILSRSFALLTEKAGFALEDIIFDPNVFAIATGMGEHDHYAQYYIEACRELKKRFPHCLISGGVSNMSFSFRGNNAIREAMHSVFLYHAIKAGMDMGIVNAGQLAIYQELDPDVRAIIEDTIFCRSPEASQRLIELAETYQSTCETEASTVGWRDLPLDERLARALVTGTADYVQVDIDEALTVYENPVDIIQGPLMTGMNEVGRLFGDGKMFLPQVVKSARVMKKAVAILTPYIEASSLSDTARKQEKILLATVKGDVHDIGKNIVSVVLGCNGHAIIDLGVMVPAPEIIAAAVENEVDIIGLSGLITPSLHEMEIVAHEMEMSGLKIPLLIGGATTSAKHTALKILPRYSGPIVHVKDASRGVSVVNSLINHYTEYTKSIRTELEALQHRSPRPVKLSLTEAQHNRVPLDWSNYTPSIPLKPGVHVFEDISCNTVIPYIDWSPFFHAWELKGTFPTILDHPDYGDQARTLYQDARHYLEKNDHLAIRAVFGLFSCRSEGDDVIIQDNIRVPFLRQQIKKGKDQPNYSLSDYIAPRSSGKQDWIGAFVVSVLGQEKTNDDYDDIVRTAVADRLAEATAEYIHQRVRTTYWGYDRDENLSNADLIGEKYRGIRPAPGYPACPDHSQKFIIFDLLNAASSLGTQLTENGAMDPPASVAGWYFAHPDARYFAINRIGEDQFLDYARRNDWSEAEARKWIGFLLE
ncbi:MAG: methionine synthase [Fidelibacterota bacterium]